MELNRWHLSIEERRPAVPIDDKEIGRYGSPVELFLGALDWQETDTLEVIQVRYCWFEVVDMAQSLNNISDTSFVFAKVLNMAGIAKYGRQLNLELLNKEALHIWIGIAYADFITG
jgi:hypothetical protein